MRIYRGRRFLGRRFLGRRLMGCRSSFSRWSFSRHPLFWFTYKTINSMYDLFHSWTARKFFFSKITKPFPQKLFCVFTVMPSKIKMQTSQYRKSRIWEMKEDKYAKSLAKNQVCAIIDMRDIRKNVLSKFIRLCMKTLWWCPFKGHKYGRRKPTETSVFEFSYLRVNSSLEELIQIKVVFIPRQGMFR